MPTQTAELTQDTNDVLADARLVYLILYVNDLVESRTFYERQLGLRVIEADEDSVKLDAGQIMLYLHRASDYGITLGGRADDSSDLVFLVDDINATREALEKRGVIFVRRRTYEIGLVTDFYDPNGHRLMIYQPSQKALSWPSGAKLRDLWRLSGRGGSDLIGPPAGPMETDTLQGLHGKPLVYMFMFVAKSDDALAFYQGRLGLRNIEQVHCCNPACPPEEKGVAKYDVGGLLITTHHVHRSPVVDDFGKIYSPTAVDPAHARGIAPVLLAADLRSLIDKLSARGVTLSGGVVRSHIGNIAKIEAMTGHIFYLYEPAPEALKWPSGSKIAEIIASSHVSEMDPVPNEAR
jgi:catechol 2,3-dioxygenase-like lactoylglutathione lyase family enzyme